MLAHRVAYQMRYGLVGAEVLILHKCDTRRCINPEHLYAGTAKQNTNDMLRQRRGRNQLGFNYGRKVTDEL